MISPEYILRTKALLLSGLVEVLLFASLILRQTTCTLMIVKTAVIFRKKTALQICISCKYPKQATTDFLSVVFSNYSSWG